MFIRISSLAAAAVLSSLAFGAGSASAAQCTSSATPVCARPSCSITVPVTCTCKEWKCVEKGGRGTAIATRGSAQAIQKAPMSTPPKMQMPKMPLRRM